MFLYNTSYNSVHTNYIFIFKVFLFKMIINKTATAFTLIIIIEQ